VTATAFEFATAGRIIAGAGRAAELPGVLAGLGSRALVCTGANPARHGELLDRLGMPAGGFPVAGAPPAAGGPGPPPAPAPAGAGRAAELPGVLAGLGSRALVCTGANPARHGELLDRLGMPAGVFPVAGEPTVELARAATEAAREHGADVVAAIGGGSVIDTG